MIKNILLALIIATTALLSLLYFSVGLYPTAGFSLIAGVAWLALEIRQKESLPTVFFLLFLALVVLGALNHLPLPLMLAGLCANLAAWDLSRFAARIREGVEDEPKRILESKHIQKLLITTGAGFAVALPPAFASLSLNFLTLVVVMLVVMLMLRASLLYLRQDDNSER
jgi:asparagine N-glycosylation enzyme membrane subunit Stt3